MTLYKNMLLAQRYNEGANMFIYKNVDTTASIYFAINNLDRAAITIYGIK